MEEAKTCRIIMSGRMLIILSMITCTVALANVTSFLPPSVFLIGSMKSGYTSYSHSLTL